MYSVSSSNWPALRPVVLVNVGNLVWKGSLSDTYRMINVKKLKADHCMLSSANCPGRDRAGDIRDLPFLQV